MPHNDPPCTCILRSHVAFDSSRLPNTSLYPRPHTQHSDARQHKHNPLTTATQPDCCNSYLKQLSHQILLTMDETATSTIRVDELVAISAIHGDALSDVTPCYHQAAQLTTAGEQLDLEAFHAAHGRISCSGRIGCSLNNTQAYLAFSLPPGYPATCAAECYVESNDLPRHVTDRLTSQLQQQAAEALGSECLHELYDTLMMEVGKWCQHKQQQVDDQASQGQSSNAQQQQQHGEDQSSEIRRILLRLDHMRARASYSKTIKQWAAQLNLTGWLLFCQGLILILLEGHSKDISQYLYLARTVCVDVDSAGRKCCERMMRVLEDSDSNYTAANILDPRGTEQPAADEACDQETAKKPVTSHQQQQQHRDAGRVSRRLTRVYMDFRELSLTSLSEVVDVLSATYPQYTVSALRQLI